MGTVPSIVSAVVELLACSTAIAVAFRRKAETLGTEERTVLAQSTVSRAHIRGDASLHQPLQKLAVTINRSATTTRFSSLPFRAKRAPMSWAATVPAHACRHRLHTHDHATAIVHQISCRSNRAEQEFLLWSHKWSRGRRLTLAPVHAPVLRLGSAAPVPPEPMWEIFEGPARRKDSAAQT